MKKIILVLTIILCSKLLFAQGIIKYYEKCLPQIFIENKEMQKYYFKNINTLLEYYTTINPDILYFYITYLDLKFDKKINDPNDNWKILLDEVIKYYLSQKSEWANNQINLLKKENYSSVKEKELISFYKEYINDKFSTSKISIPAPIDSNRMDFYTYIYLSKKSDLIYDSSINYAKLRQDINNHIVKNIYSIEEDRSSFAKQFPFLFKDSYLDKNFTGMNLYAFEFIEKEIKEKYINKNQIYLKLNTSYDPYRIKGEYNDFYPFIVFEDGFELTNNLRFSGSISVYIKLKRELESFSTINFSVGYSQFKVLKDNLSNYTFNGYKYAPHLGVLESVNFNNIIDDSYSLDFGFSIPVYYYNTKLFLEIGINYNYLKSVYSYKITGEGSFITYNQDIQDLKFEFSNHLLSPEILIVYSFNDNFRLKNYLYKSFSLPKDNYTSIIGVGISAEYSIFKF